MPWLKTFFLPAHNLLCSRKAAVVVATAFTLAAVPITTSAVGTAADILDVVVVAGAAAALLAAADEVNAAVSAAAAYLYLRIPTSCKHVENKRFLTILYLQIYVKKT